MVEKSVLTREDLVMKIEKIEGKLEVMDNFAEQTNDRINQIFEQVGELRSTIIEKDRSFDEFKSTSAKMFDAVKDLKPERISKEMKNIITRIEQNDGKIKKTEGTVSGILKEIKSIRRLMKKIKSFENVQKIKSDIDSKLSELSETKNYVDRLAGKVEGIFHELSEGLKETKTNKEKLEDMEKMVNELARSIDQTKIKLDTCVMDEDVAKIKKMVKEGIPKFFDVSDSLKKNIKVLDERTSKLDDSIKKSKIFMSKVIDKKMKKIEETESKLTSIAEDSNAALNQLESLRKRFEVLSPKLQKEKGKLRRFLESLKSRLE